MNYNNRRRQNEERKSKRLLCNSMKKKIETTMIGALSSIENHLGFLWDDQNISESQRSKMKQKYNELRSEILDRGNRQSRAIESEMNSYTIHYNDQYLDDITFLHTDKEK
jgi:hypothetical protein